MNYRHWTLIFLFTFPLLISGFSQKAEEFQIAFYNVENLFDTLNSADTRDGEFTPNGSKEWNSKRYFKKLEKLSEVIVDIGKAEKSKGGPTILGVCEVENISVLQDLIHTKKLRKSGYEIIHQDSPDKRGIDVALLFRAKNFQAVSSKSYPVYIFNPISGKRIYTRDLLLVSGLLHNRPLHIIVNHWPSRWGGELRSQPLRIGAAQVCRHIVDSIYSADSTANIIIMGDFNDDPNNISIENYLWAGDNIASLKKEQLYNTSYPLFKDGFGTLKFRGKWNLFDQLIVSQNLTSTNNEIKLVKTKIFKSDYLVQQEGKYKGYPFRTFGGKKYLNGYSDHLPTYILLEIK